MQDIGAEMFMWINPLPLSPQTTLKISELCELHQNLHQKVDFGVFFLSTLTSIEYLSKRGLKESKHQKGLNVKFRWREILVKVLG